MMEATFSSSSSSSASTPLLHPCDEESIEEPLPTSTSDNYDYAAADDDDDDDDEGYWWRRRAFLDEAKMQMQLAIPLILVGLLTYSLHIISLMFVGHLGQLQLSGASMATSFAYVTGFSLLLGMSSALETTCGRSYGAKRYHMIGVHTQRAMFILLLICIPITFIWVNARAILIALGQDPHIAAEAGIYAFYMIPGLFAYGLLQCIIRFFQTQNVVYPMMVSSAITTLLHVVLCWILVCKLGFGSQGAAVSNSVSYWVNTLSLGLYVKYSSSVSESWTGFSRAALSDIPAFIRLAIPSALMVCVEMWSFEMIVLLSGLLSNPALETSVLSVCLNTTSLVWVIPEGLSGAVSTRVSNLLGAGRPRAARLAGTVVLWMTTTETILVALTLVLIRNIWGYAYSDEMEVISFIAAMMPLLAVTNILDGLTCVLSGIIRGCGWQKFGAFINLGSFYLIGIPIAVLLAFNFDMGGRGLWLGIMLALLIQVTALFTITAHTNWEQEAKNITRRISDTKLPAKQIS